MPRSSARTMRIFGLSPAAGLAAQAELGVAERASRSAHSGAIHSLNFDPRNDDVPVVVPPTERIGTASSRSALRLGFRLCPGCDELITSAANSRDVVLSRDEFG